MLKIRLFQTGKKHRRSYRVVVAEARSKRGGKYIEKIGLYDLSQKPPFFSIDKNRLQYWQEHGAQMTEKVRQLINQNQK